MSSSWFTGGWIASARRSTPGPGRGRGDGCFGVDGATAWRSPVVMSRGSVSWATRPSWIPISGLAASAGGVSAESGPFEIGNHLASAGRRGGPVAERQRRIVRAEADWSAERRPEILWQEPGRRPSH